MKLEKQALQAVHKLIEDNFLVFCKLELKLEIANMHKEWADIIQDHNDCLIMAPRDHGKSHMIIRAYTLWKAKYDPHVREILIIGIDAQSAQENLDKLKEMIRDIGSLECLMPVNRKGYDSATKLSLSNGVEVKSRGYFAQLRGRHPQLILLDDILGEKNSLSSKMREKVRLYFYKVIYPMKDKGTKKMRNEGYQPKIVVVGTAQNEMDLYNEIIEKGEFTSLKQSAIKDEAKKIPLWHERYSWDDLMVIKKRVGSLVFAQEYKNEPIQDGTSLFPKALMMDLTTEFLTYQTDDKDCTGNRYMGVDLSIPGNSDGDYTVIIIGEHTGDGNINIIYMYRGKPNSMKKQVDMIADACMAFNITLGYVESNLFQRVYAEHFKRKTNLPIKGLNVTASNKNSLEGGVLTFRPAFENNKFKLPYKTHEDKVKTKVIVKEFTGFIRKDGKLGNFTEHDDTVMAMWHMLKAQRSGGFTYTI